MAKFIKPSGVEVEVNDSSAEAAKALGWKPAPKKRGPKKKAE